MEIAIIIEKSMCDNKSTTQLKLMKGKERKKFINKLAIDYRKRKFNLVAKA